MMCSRMFWFGVLALGLVYWQGSVAQADAPQYLPIQGYLADAEDKPVQGSLAMRFRLYSSSTASAGAVIYEEVKPTVNVDRGYFTAYLGEQETLELSLFKDHPIVFVGIRVGDDDDELSPLLQLATTPYTAYAQYCEDASTLGGKQASSFASSDHQHAFSQLTGLPSGLDDGDQDTGLLTIASAGWLSASVVGRSATLSPAIGACGAGSSIRAISANGTVTCEADDDTLTTNASGLTTGTLGTGLYSAYADLTAESYLDDNAPTDLLTQGQAASKYLPLTGGTLTGGLTAPSYAYSAGQQRSLQIPGPAFVPIDLGDGDLNYLRRLHNRLHYSSTALAPGGRVVTFDAPLNVPQGAVLNSLTCYYRQANGNGTTVGLVAEIFRVSNTTAAASSLVSVTVNSTTAKTGVTAVAGNPATTQVVDLEANFYTLRATFGVSGAPGGSEPNQSFEGCRVGYTISSPD
jgi:hypothetical protein